MATITLEVGHHKATHEVAEEAVVEVLECIYRASGEPQDATDEAKLTWLASTLIPRLLNTEARNAVRHKAHEEERARMEALRESRDRLTAPSI